jgi:hypothetical protein
MQQTHQWYLVSSHGSVLFYIAAHPDSTVAQIADALSLTTRTIWNIVADLRRSGMLKFRKQGRRHYYSVDLDAPFRHPALPAFPLRVVLARLVDGAARPEESSVASHSVVTRRSPAGLADPELEQKVREVRLAMIQSHISAPQRSDSEVYARPGSSER